MNKTNNKSEELNNYEIENHSKLEAFNRLETSRKEIKEFIDYDEQRQEAMNKKYGDID